MLDTIAADDAEIFECENLKEWIWKEVDILISQYAQEVDELTNTYGCTVFLNELSAGKLRMLKSPINTLLALFGAMISHLFWTSL